MRSEADSLPPAGDGLAVIRQKIDRRRARRFWVVPVAGVASAAAVGTLAFAIFANTSGRRTAIDNPNPAPVATQSTTAPTESASPTPAPTDQPVVVDNTLAIWPFATAVDVAGWDRAAQSWAADPQQTAVHFVQTFAGDTLSQVSAEGDTAGPGGIHAVSVSRKVDNGPTIEVAVVHVRRWSASGPWSVIDVAHAPSGFTNVTAGTTVASPQDVRGVLHTEESYVVSLYPAGATKPIATARSATANDHEWGASLRFGATSGTGALIAVSPSMADGGLGHLLALPIRFGTTSDALSASPSASPSTTTTDGLPGSMRAFAGVKDGRVALFGTTSGRVVSYLTDQQPGGGVTAVSVSPDRQWVYFIRGAGTCANAIARVPLSGGTEALVQVRQRPTTGYAFDTMSAGTADGLAWIERNCANDQNIAMGWSGAVNGAAGRIVVNGGPPTITGTPHLSPDRTKVAFVYVSGMQHQFATVDASSARQLSDAVMGAADTHGLIDFDWAPDGSLVVLSDPAAFYHVSADLKTASPLFVGNSNLGNRIDVSKDGSGVLISDPQQGTVMYFTITAGAAVRGAAAIAGMPVAGSW